MGRQQPPFIGGSREETEERREMLAKMLAVLIATFVTQISGHGSMNIPPSRNAGADATTKNTNNGCQASACMWFSQGCFIGCANCTDDYNQVHQTDGWDDFGTNDFANPCGSKMRQTLPKQYETYPIPSGVWAANHPWRAPGSAPVLDSCGLSGGSYRDNWRAAGNGKDTIVHRQGFPGTLLPPVKAKTVWKAGSVVEVAFGLLVNHGGGYIYRLCPAGSNLTEACFWKRSLKFHGDTQILRWLNGTESKIPATRVTNGTFPEDSMWSMIPIPACSGELGGEQGVGCDRPQFPPPPGCDSSCWGYQSRDTQPCPASQCDITEIPDIVDFVEVPEDLPLGDYVISWRWDCEQTAQVWNGCGDVTIIA